MTSVESIQSEFDPATVNMPSCADCGAYYATWEDLLRHRDKHCPVTGCKTGKAKKKMSPKEERRFWLDTLQDEVNNELKEDYNKSIQEMMDEEGKSEKDAVKRTYNEFVPRIRKSYRQALARYLLQMQKMQETDMYQKLMQTVENLMGEEEYSLEEAIKQALRQRKFMFDELVKEESDGSESEEEGGEEEEEESDL